MWRLYPSFCDLCNGHRLAQTLFRGGLWFPKGLSELAAQLSRLVKRDAAGDHTRDNAVPKESPFGISQMLKTNRERQFARDGQGLCIIHTTEAVYGLLSDIACRWAGPARSCTTALINRPLALMALKAFPML